MVLCPSRHNILHETIIEAPIDKVWDVLVDTDDWKWNKWFRLECASGAKTGQKGKLKVSFEGDDTWETFDFTFGQVDEKSHLLEWSGSVAGGLLFQGRHHLLLEALGPNQTRLEHIEKFGGLLPALGMGLPYKKLVRNYLLTNEALKAHVEASM
jgi:hypothetical protein